MPKSSYPWPTDGSVFWRSRHLLTGDTTPPARSGGAPSLTTRVAISEQAPSGDGGGVYDSLCRGVGLGEPPTSAALNRGLYSVQSGLDALAELDVAQLTETSAHAAQDAGNLRELDLSNVAKWPATPTLVYLGPGTTTAAVGADPEYRCSNYVKPWADGGLQPLLSGVTGVAYSVADILSEGGGGTSLYAIGDYPTDLEAYPWGSPGVINTVIIGAPGVSHISFTGGGAGTAPEGTPAGGIVCFFNYSLYERLLATHGNLLNCFAISTTIVPGVPSQYGLNRDVTAAGANWLAADIVYTSHYAYCPTLFFNENIPAAGLDLTLLHGTCMPSAWASESYTLELLRFAGAPQVLEPPLEATEPTGATQRSFDYANALFRANDGMLRGTIGLDVRGDANDGVASRDVFAGYLHRKSIAFLAANGTTCAVGNSCSYNAATRTIALGGGGHGHGAAVADTHLIVGVDCVELYDTGVNVGLYVIESLGDVAHPEDLIIRDLDGNAAAYGVDILLANGTCTIFRTAFRSGGLYSAAEAIVPGNVLVGDAYGATQTPPATLYSGGADNLIIAYNSPEDRRNFGSGVEAQSPAFRLLADGSLYFSGEQLLGLDEFGHMYSEIYTGGTLWNAVGADSRSIGFAGFQEGGADPWQARRAYFHFMNDAAHVNASNNTFLELSATATAASSLPVKSIAGIMMGAPGGLQFPVSSVFEDTKRDSGFIYTGSDAAGIVTLGCGITTFEGLARNWLFREVASVRNPPVGTFGASASRMELDTASDIGWQVEKTFYHDLTPAKAQPYYYAANPWQLLADGAYRSVWQHTDPGGGTTRVIVFPLQLPENCRVTKVEVAIYLSPGVNGTADIVFSACAWSTKGNSVGTTSLGNAVPAGATTVLPAGGLVCNTVINNSANWYQVFIQVGVPTTQTVEIQGCRITYACVDLLPA